MTRDELDVKEGYIYRNEENKRNSIHDTSSTITSLHPNRHIKKKKSINKYESPYVREARLKAEERARRAYKKSKEIKPWNNDFTKEIPQYFDNKIHKSEIFKLQPRDPSKPSSKENLWSNLREYHPTSHPTTSTSSMKRSSKLTMRTNETSPVNSPHKKYGFIPRDHVSSQVDMSSPVSDTHDKQPLDSDHHDTPHSRQDIHHSNRDPHYSQPTYSSAHHNPGTSSPHRMSISSSTQTLDSTTPWMPSYHDTRRGEPERQSSSPHRGTRERINATMSPQRRRNSSPHTSDRRVLASPRTHRTSFERESVPIAPKRVTTRATSPFDPNVVDRLLSTKSVGDNIPPSNPTQFPLSHSRGPEGTLEATLVRILEHQARAQEVSSTANSTALGNVSKLVTEMGKLIISAGDKKKHRRRSKSQTFASSSRSATASPTLRSQHEMLVYTPHRDVYDSTQQTQTHGPSDSTGLIEEADASRTIHVNKREESICKQNKWTGPVKANSCNKRKTKADMLDHVLSKIQAMEHQEQETSRLLVNRKNRDRHADIPVSTSSSKEVKINHKGSPLRRVVTKPPVNESLQDAIFMQKTEFDYLDRIESAISHTQDTTDVLNLPEEKGGLAVYKSPVDGENRISEPSNELQRAMKYVAADSVMRHDVKEYQLEFKRWKKLRECVFRENKTSLHDVVVRLSDALLNDLLDGATDELETLFAEIADKFIDKI